MESQPMTSPWSRRAATALALAPAEQADQFPVVAAE